jgi:hypothetical protein
MARKLTSMYPIIQQWWTILVEPKSMHASALNQTASASSFEKKKSKIASSAAQCTSKDQPLAESAARLMHLHVYDNRDSSHHSAPSPSLCYSLTHAHSTLSTSTLLTITCTQILWFLERLTRSTVSCCETTRTRLTVCLPVQPSVCEAF